MGTVRNFINVVGITPEDQLPQKIDGQMIVYSEIETLFLPEGTPVIDNMYQIMVEVKIDDYRQIKTPVGTIVSLDGRKQIKIVYTNQENTANVNTFKQPYNTFFELPTGKEGFNQIDIYVLDGYFDLIGENKIYCYLLYLIDIKMGLEEKEEQIIEKMRTLKEALINGNS